MKQFFTKHADGSIATSNFPIQEEGADSFEFEVTEEQHNNVNEGLHDWSIIGGALSLTESNRKDLKEESILKKEKEEKDLKTKKIEILEKITAGAATKAEITEFTNLI